MPPIRRREIAEAFLTASFHFFFIYELSFSSISEKNKIKNALAIIFMGNGTRTNMIRVDLGWEFH